MRREELWNIVTAGRINGRRGRGRRREMILNGLRHGGEILIVVVKFFPFTP